MRYWYWTGLHTITRFITDDDAAVTFPPSGRGEGIDRKTYAVSPDTVLPPSRTSQKNRPSICSLSPNLNSISVLFGEHKNITGGVMDGKGQQVILNA